eukprot:gene18443-28457_t
MNEVARRRLWLKKWRRSLDKGPGKATLAEGDAARKRRDSFVRGGGAAERESLMHGVHESAKKFVQKRVWNWGEPLTDMEVKYVTNRGLKVGTDVGLHVGEDPHLGSVRMVVALRSYRAHDIIMAEPSPIFSPRQHHCTGCDRPPKKSRSSACAVCDAPYCSAGCLAGHKRLHSVECRLHANFGLRQLADGFAHSSRVLHSSLYVPVQARFLPKRNGLPSFLSIVTLICRSLSLAQGQPGKFIDPMQLPFLSFLPYIPIPAIGHPPVPPIELALVYQACKAVAEVVFGVEEAGRRFDSFFEENRAVLWNLWEVLLFNRNGRGAVGTAVHPVMSLFSPSDDSNSEVVHPTNALAYLVCTRTIRRGDLITVPYPVPDTVPTAMRSQLLRA